MNIKASRAARFAMQNGDEWGGREREKKARCVHKANNALNRFKHAFLFFFIFFYLTLVRNALLFLTVQIIPPYDSSTSRKILYTHRIVRSFLLN